MPWPVYLIVAIAILAVANFIVGQRARTSIELEKRADPLPSNGRAPKGRAPED